MFDPEQQAEEPAGLDTPWQRVTPAAVCLLWAKSVAVTVGASGAWFSGLPASEGVWTSAPLRSDSARPSDVISDHRGLAAVNLAGMLMDMDERTRMDLKWPVSPAPMFIRPSAPVCSSLGNGLVGFRVERSSA